ncbi:GntR family transcriptional regulator [Leucobacter sp. L43]|uniref:GntR family transcriptional regulator n=1 Tax=Leucobacter sp. L43 TaxID=2798040 RepID=UPI00190586CB|nr:GntR family transcriptional regulator [Leucobacter sp. L43]
MSDAALDLFVIDPGSPEPPYRQLHDGVVRAISQGRLAPGAKLPTVRGLAAHLGLAANTVASAYRALEATGVIEGRGRAGTFVSLGDDPVEAAARGIALGAVERLRALGVSDDRAAQILADAGRSAETG